MPYDHPRCRIVPETDDRVRFLIDGTERTVWHFGPGAPRPFFHPVVGPSGTNLVRMGHPGASNHDHHRGVWFAHAKVTGVDFWSDNTEARVRQREWIAYHDGDDEAIAGFRIDWLDGHDPRPLIRQELIVAVRPGEREGEWFLELQTTFTPTSEMLELQQSNFGFLAVRVAAHVSEHFGDGLITDPQGREGEPAIFGHASPWMDYTGPVPGTDDREGITYLNHPANPGAPGHPPKWHVREDGWMGASLCRDDAVILTRDAPLVLRYLLHVHTGPVDPHHVATIARAFETSAGFIAEKSTAKHQQYTIRRKD